MVAVTSEADGRHPPARWGPASDGTYATHISNPNLMTGRTMVPKHMKDGIHSMARPLPFRDLMV